MDKFHIPEDSLVILVGVAGSGKSYLAKKLAKDDNEIISSDEIRKEINGDESDQRNASMVFEEFHKRIEERLQSGKMTIADATSLEAFARKNLYDIATKYGRPIRVVIMNVPLIQIKKQNQQRKRNVPEYVIDKMFSDLEKEYDKIHSEVENMPDAMACDVFVKPEKQPESINLKQHDNYELDREI